MMTDPDGVEVEEKISVARERERERERERGGSEFSLKTASKVAY